MAKSTSVAEVAAFPAGVKSASRVLDLFELLVRDRHGLTVSQISRELTLPVSSVYELVQTLVQREYLELMPAGKAYRLGVKLLEIGSTYLQAFSLLDEAQALMRELVRTCDETVNLAILDNRDIVFMAKEEGTKSMRLVSHVGKRLPAHATALGKVLLSALTDLEVNQLYRGLSLQRITPKTVPNVRKLTENLEWVRAHGYALDNQETSPGLLCVAAPVHSYERKFAAALSISVPTVRMTKQRLTELTELVVACAMQISHNIGHRTDNHRDGSARS
jgi:IclR family KDG regulon transcriptional repressor